MKIPAKVDAALFDLDGVLVDTAKYHYLAWKETAGKLGFDLKPSHNELLKGVSRNEAMEIVLRLAGIDLDPDEKESRKENKNRRYLEFLKDMTQKDLLPGSLTVLGGLKKGGMRLALGSASKNAPYILEKLRIGGFFDAIVDGNLVTKAKPHPEIFITAAKLLGIPPHRCMVFEDAVAGIQSARAGGMYAVGIGDGHILSEADEVFEDLQAFWERWSGSLAGTHP